MYSTYIIATSLSSFRLVFRQLLFNGLLLCIYSKKFAFTYTCTTGNFLSLLPIHNLFHNWGKTNTKNMGDLFLK